MLFLCLHNPVSEKLHLHANLQLQKEDCLESMDPEQLLVVKRIES